MRKIIYTQNHVTITKENEKYEISWEFGLNNYIRYFEISKENAFKAMKSEEDLRAVMLYAETGHWPTGKSREEISRDFISSSPDRLIRFPNNQNYFTEEELKKLLPKVDTKNLNKKQNKYYKNLLKKYHLL